MKFHIVLAAFALLLVIGSTSSICFGPICVFDQKGLFYIHDTSAPLDTQSLDMNITDCTRTINNEKYTRAEFYLQNVDWNMVTCMLLIDGKNTPYTVFVPLHTTELQGSILYRSSYDSTYGCGAHTAQIKCFNAKYNISEATQIVSSNTASFTCTNCCAGSAPIGNLLCTNNCNKLPPPPGGFYTCNSGACACVEQKYNVSCSSGVGNASGQICINDCPQAKFCNQGCTCQSYPDVNVSVLNGACYLEGSSLSAIFEALVSPPQQDYQNFNCTLYFGGSPIASASPDANGRITMSVDGSGLGQGTEWHVSCTYMGRSYISNNSLNYSCSTDCSLGNMNVTGQICKDDCGAKYGSNWKCREFCGGCYLETENVLCSSGKGVTNNATQACINDCSTGYTCIANCTCAKDPPPQVSCSSGVGNASGQLCINDCKEKLGANYACNSACKCDKLPDVSCASGEGNASGQICINDCKEKLGNGFTCNSACKCEILPPQEVKCSSGTGNASGQLCVNDCPANYLCTPSCTCQKNTTSISSCSAGTGYAALCLDDCTTKLGQNYKCDINRCTCVNIGDVPQIASSGVPTK